VAIKGSCHCGKHAVRTERGADGRDTLHLLALRQNAARLWALLQTGAVFAWYRHLKRSRRICGAAATVIASISAPIAAAAPIRNRRTGSTGNARTLRQSKGRRQCSAARWN